MAQIFSPAADAWLRLFLIGAVSLAVGSILFAVGFARSDWVTGARIHPRKQPVPFSHRHHAGELGIDCMHCHTSAASSPRAGLPPTHTCMTCHSQIWTGASMLAPVRASLANNRSLDWQRVALLPDYVYFRHDVHIVKGIACAECHGSIDKMALTYRAVPLTMQFCLDCHRNPAPHLRPRDQVTNMLWHAPDEGGAQGRALLAQYGIRVANSRTARCVTDERAALRFCPRVRDDAQLEAFLVESRRTARRGRLPPRAGGRVSHRGVDVR